MLLLIIFPCKTSPYILLKAQNLIYIFSCMKRYKLKEKELFVSLQEFKEVPAANNLIFKRGACTFLFLPKKIKLNIP